MKKNNSECVSFPALSSNWEKEKPCGLKSKLGPTFPANHSLKEIRSDVLTTNQGRLLRWQASSHRAASNETQNQYVPKGSVQRQIIKHLQYLNQQTGDARLALRRLEAAILHHILLQRSFKAKAFNL